MKSGLFVSLFAISTLSFALVQSDFEAKQFFKDQGAVHSDFIEAADTLIIDSTKIIPKGSHCISLPITTPIQNRQICCSKDAGRDSLSFPGKVIVWAKNRPLNAVRIRNILYIGRSFKEIANEILSKKIH